MKRIIIILAVMVVLFSSVGCYKQAYGPSFEDNRKAEKDRNWYFGFRDVKMKPLISVPLLLNDQLYVNSMGGMVYCIDKERGQLVDTFSFNNKKPLKAGFRSGPVSDGKSLYVGCFDHNVYALEPNTGMIRWVFATSGKIEGTPVLMEGKIYVGTWTKRLYCIDKSNGETLWEFETKDKVRCTPAAFGGKVYFGDASGNFYCLTAGGSQPKLDWEFKAGNEIYGEPATDGDAVWFGSLDGNVYCLDAITGEQRWIFKTDGEIWGGPCIDTFAINLPTTAEGSDESEEETTEAGTMTDEAGVSMNEDTEPDDQPGEEGVSMETGPMVTWLYIGSMNARFYILDAATGELATYFDPELGEDVTVQPYVCSEGFPNDHGVQSTAVTDEKHVYFGAGDFIFRALDKVTGKPVWSFITNGEIRSKPLIYEGKVVFGCDDTYFYGLKTESGYPVKGAL